MPKWNWIFRYYDDYLNTSHIILTTSNNRVDVMECYKIGIAGYLIKPLKYDDYVDRIKSQSNTGVVMINITAIICTACK
jgi:DNA-binding NarL/FixJ family response regulator